MRTRTLFLLVAAITVLAGTVAPVAAQSARGDVAGGYAYLHEKGLSMPAGWFASAGGNINDWIGIVGAVSGHYKTETVGAIETKARLHTFVAGPKFTSGHGAVVPYYQVLFGGGRVNAEATVAGRTANVVTNGFDIQPGLGVDIMGGGSVGLRVGINGDYIRTNGAWAKEFQFIAGAVVRW